MRNLAPICGRRLGAVALGQLAAALALAALVGAPQAHCVLVQPHNYLLDDSSLTGQPVEQSGSLAPFANDNQANEQQADRDIVSIIGDSLARLRYARMLDNHENQHEQQQTAAAAADSAGLSQEMAELLSEQQAAASKQESEQQQSLSSSVASMLMNAAAEAAAATAAEGQPEAPAMRARGTIMELDTSTGSGSSAGQQSAAQLPSKSDLKQQQQQQSGPIQWYNPKETIPVLKISSMATPSKYKKVYFRSEKKLVDGAFHSPSASETAADKKSGLSKAFGHSASAANVQRRSSRGSGSGAPPSVLQDGVIDFLKKFRDVYVQTRPAGAAPSGPLNFASSVMSAAASSPLASFLAAPAGQSSSRPGANLMGALSTASQMAAQFSQAAAGSPTSSGSSSSSSSGATSGLAAGSASGAAAIASAASNTNKSPLSTQSYVSFWSKTFPTWVRKMLKQMRRRSLYNSSKRQKHNSHHHHHHHQQHAGVSQKVASSAVASIERDSSSDATGSQTSSSSSSSSSSS